MASAGGRNIAPGDRLVRLGRDRRGATLVEFGLVVIPFLALILAVVQTCITLFTQQAMDTATEKVARLVMTGQARASAMSRSAFKTAVCERLPDYMDCGSVMVDLTAYSAISEADVSPPVLTFAQGKPTNNWSYDLGEGGEVVRVRIMYLAPSVMGPLGFTLANQPNGKRLLISSAIFRNESA